MVGHHSHKGGFREEERDLKWGILPGNREAQEVLMLDMEVKLDKKEGKKELIMFESGTGIVLTAPGVLIFLCVRNTNSLKLIGPSIHSAPVLGDPG